MFETFAHLRQAIATRVLIASCVAMGWGASASAQVLSCPINSSVTVSSVAVPSQATCVIESGVTLGIATGAAFENWYTVNAFPATLINDGILSNSGSFANYPSSTVTNFGTMFNNSGAFFDGGTLTNAAILDNFGGIGTSTLFTLTLNNTGTLTNAGQILPYQATNFVGATFNNTGTLNIGTTPSCSTCITGSFTNNGRLENFAGGTINVNSDYFLNLGTLTNNASFLNDARAALTNSGNFVNNAGANFSNAGSFVNAAFVDPFGNVANSATNYGTITNLSGGLLSNDSLFTNATGATIQNQGEIVNANILVVNSGSTINNLAGSSFFQITGAQTQLSGTINSVPAVQILGGMVAGNGTINGDLDSAGNIQPGFGIGGTLTVNGDFAQSAAGTLTIDLAEDSPGDFSVLDVSALVSLDGTLDLQAIPGLVLNPGDDFTFLDFGSLSGSFTNIDLFFTCPTNDTCSIVTTANSMSLDIIGPNGGGGGGGGGTTTPEPASFALLAGGLFAVAVSIRKRTQGSLRHKAKISSEPLS